MKKLIMSLAVMAFMFLLSAPYVMAQCDPNNPPCEGDFDCDCDVDGSDAAGFKSDFGRSGFNFPCPPCLGPAPVPKTGMTTSEGTGDDGDLERGVTWPNPRFLDNLDGTITDNLTGLIWLKNANCFGQRTWSQALSDCNGLASGQCDLTDSSNVGDWRLPNIKEMQSLIHFGYINPSVPNTAGTGKCSAGDPFNSLQSFSYWSSTAYIYSTVDAWGMAISNGDDHLFDKDFPFFVLPVRGGQ